MEDIPVGVRERATEQSEPSEVSANRKMGDLRILLPTGTLSGLETPAQACPVCSQRSAVCYHGVTEIDSAVAGRGGAHESKARRQGLAWWPRLRPFCVVG